MMSDAVERGVEGHEELPPEHTVPAKPGPGPFVRQADGTYRMELALADDRPALKFDAIGGLVTVNMELVGRAPGAGCEWEAQVVMREEAAFRLWAHLDGLFRENARKLP